MKALNEHTSPNVIRSFKRMVKELTKEYDLDDYDVDGYRGMISIEIGVMPEDEYGYAREIINRLKEYGMEDIKYSCRNDYNDGNSLFIFRFQVPIE